MRKASIGYLVKFGDTLTDLDPKLDSMADKITSMIDSVNPEKFGSAFGKILRIQQVEPTVNPFDNYLTGGILTANTPEKLTRIRIDMFSNFAKMNWHEVLLRPASQSKPLIEMRFNRLMQMICRRRVLVIAPFH